MHRLALKMWCSALLNLKRFTSSGTDKGKPSIGGGKEEGVQRGWLHHHLVLLCVVRVP